MKTWRVGVRFCDVRRRKFRRLLLAPDAQLLFCHLGLYSPIVLLKYSIEWSVIGVCLAWRCSTDSHLVIIVLKVRMLALQLNHLQPGDPVLLFGRHQITVRIPALSFSINGRRLCKHAQTFDTIPPDTPTLGIYTVFEWGVSCAGGGAGWRDLGTWSSNVLNEGRRKANPFRIIMALNSVCAAYHLPILTCAMSHLFAQANVTRLYETYHQGDEQCLLCSWWMDDYDYQVINSPTI